MLWNAGVLYSPLMHSLLPVQVGKQIRSYEMTENLVEVPVVKSEPTLCR